jgi:hypothetical protein
MPEETVSGAELAYCECDPCKRKRGEPNGVHAGTIHAYTSQPRNGWQVRRTTAELAEMVARPTFGIELETSAPERIVRDLPNRPNVPYLPFGADEATRAERDRMLVERERYDVRNDAFRARQRREWADAGNMSADEAVSVAAPRGLWHPKHDGSVSGPEFASQPGTLAYWRSVRPHVASMFRALLHGGMRSHDGDTCGMHVNIGSDAFDGSDHLERFMALVAVNPRWTTRMAQRTHESMQSWANFRDIGDADNRSHLARTWRDYGYAHTSHCSAVNLAHEGRVEFRIPRGTLRLDRFYAKLEWVASMVEYTRNADNATQVSAYMHWVVGTGEYAALVAYMRERFPARLEGTAAA